MSTGATASSAPAAPANGNQATRQSSGSAATSKSNASSSVDLFSSLMGLLSATDDNPLLANGGGLTDDNGAEDGDADALLLTDPAALGNPLADLIGWPGATSASLSPAQGAVNGSAPSTALSAEGANGEADQTGLSLQGMTLLAEPVAADPGTVAQIKTASAGSASNPTTATAATAATAGDPADPDAVSVQYGDTGEAALEAETTSPTRSPNYMAARPANWRSTTALPASGTTASRASPASSATASQAAQNTAPQRGLQAEALQPASRNGLVQNERPTGAAAVEATGAELGAVAAPGQASQGHTGSSGSGAGDGLLMGSALPEPGDLDAPDEAFSLDAALGTEEELEGVEFMTPQHLRNANVRVGEGTDEAIDIRLSLEGDAVNVEFRSDNAEVRAGLQHNAGTSLSDLMQRGGVQLGGVSVGGQSQPSGGQAGNPDSPPRRIEGASGRSPSGGSAGGAPGANPGQQPPMTRRSDGGPALDVFA